MTTAALPGAVAPYYVVAREAGLEGWALAKLEPDGFRVPEHVQQVDGITYLTAEGVQVLAKAVEQRGYAVMAHSLRVLARDLRETPSRRLITTPLPKGATVDHPWMHRRDCGAAN